MQCHRLNCDMEKKELTLSLLKPRNSEQILAKSLVSQIRRWPHKINTLRCMLMKSPKEYLDSGASCELRNFGERAQRQVTRVDVELMRF